MRTDFTPISSALDKLVEEIVSLHKDILARANAERVEALVLFAKMKETKADLDQLGAITEAASDQLGAISDVAVETAELVGDAIEGNVPECDYEDFVGYCDACGATISAQSDYHDNEYGIFCEACSKEIDTKVEEAIESAE